MSFDKGLGSLQWIRRNSSHLGSSQLWLPSLGSSSRLAAQAGPLFWHAAGGSGHVQWID